MKVAVIGSRKLTISNLADYLPEDVSEIVSGGAKGIDAIAKAYAITHRIPCKEFLPNYARFGRVAPLKRNDEIILYSDFVLAFWDGVSRGTNYVINQCKRKGIPIQVIIIP